jgi:hypothetical protein
MDKASEAAALAGIADNRNYPMYQRLGAATQALTHYIEQTDRLQSLLDDLRKSYPDPAPNSTQAIVIERLAGILEGD